LSCIFSPELPDFLSGLNFFKGRTTWGCRNGEAKSYTSGEVLCNHLWKMPGLAKSTNSDLYTWFFAVSLYFLHDLVGYLILVFLKEYKVLKELQLTISREK